MQAPTPAPVQQNDVVDDDDEEPLNENDDDDLDDVDQGEDLNTAHLVLAQFDKVSTLSFPSSRTLVCMGKSRLVVLIALPLSNSLYTAMIMMMQLFLFCKVTRTKSRWKCTLKDGIMHINNKDILFNKVWESIKFLLYSFHYASWNEILTNAHSLFRQQESLTSDSVKRNPSCQKSAEVEVKTKNA